MTAVETQACMFCGKTSIIDLPFDAVRELAVGAAVQDVLPLMPPAYREVVRSGIHPECWESAFGPVPAAGCGS